MFLAEGWRRKGRVANFFPSAMIGKSTKKKRAMCNPLICMHFSRGLCVSILFCLLYIIVVIMLLYLVGNRNKTWFAFVKYIKGINFLSISY